MTRGKVFGVLGRTFAVLFLGGALCAGMATGTASADFKAHAVSPTSSGSYWLVASDGGIFSFGDASFHGSTGGIHLNQPIVGMARTPDGEGYWLVASDGGIFSFGDAKFYGSTGGIAPQPADRRHGGRRPTVRATGSSPPTAGSSASGTPRFHGSTGGTHLNQPIVGMAATPDGQGYWLVASDGGIFSLRRRHLPRLDRRHPPEPADRRHGRDARRSGLLARRLRRRHLQLR